MGASLLATAGERVASKFAPEKFALGYYLGPGFRLRSAHHDATFSPAVLVSPGWFHCRCADVVDASAGGGGHARLCNLSGWPDLIVPAGVTSNPVLPVTRSLIGPAFSEARLLALGYAFEQALPARVLPAKTPALPGETINY